MKHIFSKLPCIGICRGNRVDVLRLNESGTKVLIKHGSEKAWKDIWQVEPLQDGKEVNANG